MEGAEMAEIQHPEGLGGQGVPGSESSCFGTVVEQERENRGERGEIM